MGCLDCSSIQTLVAGWSRLSLQYRLVQNFKDIHDMVFIGFHVRYDSVLIHEEEIIGMCFRNETIRVFCYGRYNCSHKIPWARLPPDWRFPFAERRPCDGWRSPSFERPLRPERSRWDDCFCSGAGMASLSGTHAGVGRGCL